MLNGMAYVRAFTDTMLFSLTSRCIDQRRWMDPKTQLQLALNEFNRAATAAASRPPPLIKRFVILDEFGPSHERMYVVGCYINDARNDRIFEYTPEKRNQSFRPIAAYVASGHFYIADTTEALKSLGIQKEKRRRRKNKSN